MDLEKKARIIWDLAQLIEELKTDDEITGNTQQAYNLCLMAQDQCLRLITTLDLYKHKELELESHDYLREAANWQEIPRIYVSEVVSDHGDPVEGALLKEQEEE